MNKKITITTVDIVNKRTVLNANETISGLTPVEQILVDSENLSFIYLMENQEDYTYIVIPEKIWPLLNDSLIQNNSVWISYKDELVELTNFNDEFAYVISNIKGNSNYGEIMVTKVEQVF